MYIGVKKRIDGTIYLYKSAYTDGRFSEEVLSQSPYNFTKIYVPDELVKNVVENDFDDDLQFNIEKYYARINIELYQREINKLKELLDNTDYIANKLSEANAKSFVSGDKTELNTLLKTYSEQLIQRQQWRARVDELEKYIRDLEG